MQAAPHPQQIARVGALRRYDILDTPREKDYDDVVAFAAALCETPICLINLVGADRQWFKAEVGLGVRETPIENSLCAHAILDDGLVEIGDTLADERTRQNPMCTAEGGLRFYAGALLVSADGYPVGALCVLDYRPRTLTDLQRRGLRVLASQVVAQLELRATLGREAMLRKEIDHRVKNSLQAVNAFVRLQSGATDSPDAREALQTVEQQIGTVAVLHDLLDQSSMAETVELARYLDRVVELLAGTVPAGVAIEGVFEPLTTRAAVAASLGTIVNELVANAVKHSLVEEGQGRIVLNGSRTQDGAYRITCRDNGTPDKTGVPPGKREGLGLKIMAAAVRQLNGTLVSEALPEGFSSVLEFPIPDVTR
ncbi:MAG TPA: histidine kinase dimerization/phosphoacceptor domain -containing protein [Sphingomonadaceae bacterium]|nr:histidine kinase dimerization/phosphoacceptor domain -containing protein [Sphingomonadaceae bacterium]